MVVLVQKIWLVLIFIALSLPQSHAPKSKEPPKVPPEGKAPPPTVKATFTFHAIQSGGTVWHEAGVKEYVIEDVDGDGMFMALLKEINTGYRGQIRGDCDYFWRTETTVDPIWMIQDIRIYEQHLKHEKGADWDSSVSMIYTIAKVEEPAELRSLKGRERLSQPKEMRPRTRMRKSLEGVRAAMAAAKVSRLDSIHEKKQLKVRDPFIPREFCYANFELPEEKEEREKISKEKASKARKEKRKEAKLKKLGKSLGKKEEAHFADYGNDLSINGWKQKNELDALENELRSLRRRREGRLMQKYYP